MTIYKIYFDPLTLCDNGCSPLLLEQLKHNLEVELGNTNNITRDINEFNQEMQERINIAGELTTAQSSYKYKKLSNLQDM
jgi:hypothetical protein